MHHVMVVVEPFRVPGFVPNDNHVFMEINTICKFCLGMPVLKDGYHVCGPCRKECTNMRRAMNAICRRAGERSYLHLVSPQPPTNNPTIATPASHFALSRSACHEKAKNPMHEAYLRCDIANKKANSTIRKQINFITEL